MNTKNNHSFTLSLFMVAIALVTMIAYTGDCRPLFGNDRCVSYCYSCGFWGDFSGFRGSGYYLLNDETPPADPNAHGRMLKHSLE